MNKDTCSFPKIFLQSLEIRDRNIVLAVQLQPTKTFRNSIRVNFVHKFRINLPQTIGGSITRYDSPSLTKPLCRVMHGMASI